MNDMNGSGRSDPSDRLDRLGPAAFTISCDDCAMRCTAACDDCVVTFLLADQPDGERSVVLDLEQARTVRLLGQAGLVPELRFRTTG